MYNEKQFQLLRRGLRPVRNNITLEKRLIYLNALSLTTHQLLTGSSYRFAEGRQPPPLNEDALTWLVFLGLFCMRKWVTGPGISGVPRPLWP